MGPRVRVVKIIAESSDQMAYFSRFIGRQGRVVTQDQRDFGVMVRVDNHRLPERFSWAELERIGDPAVVESAGRAQRAAAGRA